MLILTLVSVVALFHLIDFFVVVYIFPDFCMPANICLQPDIFNFTFSGGRHFCIPVNVPFTRNVVYPSQFIPKHQANCDHSHPNQIDCVASDYKIFPFCLFPVLKPCLMKASCLLPMQFSKRTLFMSRSICYSLFSSSE